MRELPSMEKGEARRERFQQEKLKGPENLPELPGDQLRFVWDQAEEDGDQVTLIRFEDRILWKERCFWGGAWRFK